MVFQDLLNQAGSLGRFQILQMTFILICNIIVSPHTLLDNFTAAIPSHRCWVPILDNDTVPDNDSGILSQDDLLKVSIPLDSDLRPDKCRPFVQPQWHLLHSNGTFPSVTEPDTEPCVDGWVYDQNTFLSTIVTEWDLVCEFQSLDSIAKFLYLAGILLGNILCGCLTDGFVIWTSAFGLLISFQYLRTNVFLLQCLFGAITIPANLLGFFLVNHMGRRTSQLFIIPLLGMSILAIIFVPYEMWILHLVLATLRGAFSSSSVGISFIYASELLPTVIRATALGVTGIAGSVGSALSPLIMILTTYNASLPWIIYGALPFLACLVVLLLPETKNQPLPDSIQDVEDEGRVSRQAKEKDTSAIKVTQF